MIAVWFLISVAVGYFLQPWVARCHRLIGVAFQWSLGGSKIIGAFIAWDIVLLTLGFTVYVHDHSPWGGWFVPILFLSLGATIVILLFSIGPPMDTDLAKTLAHDERIWKQIHAEADRVTVKYQSRWKDWGDIHYVHWVIDGSDQGYMVTRYDGSSAAVVGERRTREEAWVMAQDDRSFVLSSDPTAVESRGIRERSQW